MKSDDVQAGAEGAAVGTAIAPGVGTVIGGALGLLGSYLGDQAATSSAKDALQAVRETNAANTWNAAENRKWQQYMSDTAYRRASDDMKSAGLNPAVMFNQGAGGSSTPPGTVIPMQSAAQALTTTGVEKARIRAEAVQGAARTATQLAERDLIAANEKLTEQNVATARTQAQLNQASAIRQWEEGKVATAMRASIGLENRKKAADLPTIEARSRVEQEDLRGKGGRFLSRWDLIRRRLPSWLGGTP